MLKVDPMGRFCIHVTKLEPILGANSNDGLPFSFAGSIASDAMTSTRSAKASSILPQEVYYRSAAASLQGSVEGSISSPLADPAEPLPDSSEVTPVFSAAPASSSDSSMEISPLSTDDKGGGKKQIDSPAPAPAPKTITRGITPWSDARVSALISKGTIQANWLPDIRATALTHLQIQNSQQREMLRFSNAIANTGANNWQVRRGSQISDQAQIAYAESLGLDPSELAATGQELLDSQGQIAAVIPDAALSEFHPEHKHFHIGETAEFGVERYVGSGDFHDPANWDSITGLEVVKTTFCLIDVNQIQPMPGSDPDHYEIIKSPANANLYNDCFADVQGIQAGWIDRYNHSLQGQEVDITDLPAGKYRIISTVNPAGWFLESDYSNNVGWTGFEISRNSNGNANLSLIPGATGGIWFDSSSNGMG